MLAFLKGSLMSVDKNSVVILDGGVGYEVFTTEGVNINLMSKIGSDVEFYIYHHIKEGIMDLYGFSTKEEKEMFEGLISVSGVGPKMGMSILNASSVPVLQQAIAEQDSSILTKVSGLGNKKAQKIILELKDKYIGFIGSQGTDQMEVIEALESMGYSRSKIQQTLRELPKNDISIEERIKMVIQEMGRE